MLQLNAILATLTEGMLRKSATSPPKLKAKGAECRNLVAFAVQIAGKYFTDASKPEDQAMISCTQHLLDCYAALKTDPYYRAKMMVSGRLFASQAVALEAYSADGVLWRTKPKMHVFMHLIEMESCPATIWCYRDEDYGGSAAQAVRSKGGWNTAQSSSQQVLDKFRAKFTLPSIE